MTTISSKLNNTVRSIFGGYPLSKYNIPTSIAVFSRLPRQIMQSEVSRKRADELQHRIMNLSIYGM